MASAAALSQDTRSRAPIAAGKSNQALLPTYWRWNLDDPFIIQPNVESPEVEGARQTDAEPMCRNDESERAPGYVLKIPQPPIATEFFRAAQRWDGYVLSVKPDSFIARLFPVVGEGPIQEAEIPLEELENEDHKLVQPGAVFYWSIGYLDRPSGRLKVSLIRFQRLPAWSCRELARARDEAERLGAFFGIS
jgi:hypothetical protein